jgi:hypothetical protein
MTSSDFSALHAAFAPYARYVPGFAFLQGLAGRDAAPEAPPVAQWVAPVFDPDELERRIRDLKAVHFWLEQNARALQATIQALEVQRMTLATLKGMNVSLAEMAQALAGSAAAASAANAPGAAQTPDPSTGGQATAAAAGAPAPAVPGVDPVRWWRALTEQFQGIAAQAMQDMAQQAAPEPSPPEPPPAPPPAARPKRARAKASPSAPAAPRPAPARRSRS